MNVHTESKIVPSHQKKNTVIAYIVLLVLLMGTLLCSVLFGAESINLCDLLAKDGDSGASVTKMIFMQIRLPRTLLAALTGILLAGAGATFQLYFRNPLAEPGIMGISPGATLGAVIVSSFSIFMGTVISVNIGAFIGALVAGLIVTVISGRNSGSAVQRLDRSILRSLRSCLQSNQRSSIRCTCGCLEVLADVAGKNCHSLLFRL